LHQTWHDYSLKQGRQNRRVKTAEESVLISIPDLLREIKEGGRTAPGIKLFALKRGLQEERR
jgi:hypothetical protein